MRHLLDPANAGFYEASGLLALSDKLVADGVFALWSTDLPDEGFLTRLRAVFARTTAEVVEFDNPAQPGSQHHLSRLQGERSRLGARGQRRNG